MKHIYGLIVHNEIYNMLSKNTLAEFPFHCNFKSTLSNGQVSSLISACHHYPYYLTHLELSNLLSC